MFLQVMNDEEKEKFLELVYKIASVDGDFAEEEQEIVDSYKKELEIDNIPETSSLEELVEYFSSKAIELKRIVLFETIGLINADDKIEKAEEEVYNKMISKFELEENSVEKIRKSAEKLQAVYDEVYDALFD